MKCTGSIIAELRKEAGYTQRTLAEALQITDKAVSKWERGLCFPDASLLPKLSLLLDADIELLLSSTVDYIREGWIGLLDLKEHDVDFGSIVHDKPMIYYILMHFLLLNITEVYVRTSEQNKEFLSDSKFETLGFNFTFEFEELPKRNMIIINRPTFLFGSDTTRQFQGAMLSKAVMKLVPEGTMASLLFCPLEYGFMYLKNTEYLFEIASEKTLGRGMVCVEMNDMEKCEEVAAFVRMYQKNTGLLLGSLEEIAYRKRLIDDKKLRDIASRVPYAKELKKLIVTNVSGKP